MNAISSLVNQDILIVGQQPWDTEIGSNCKNVAIELSKTNRVLYVNSPLDRITLLRGKKDAKIMKRIAVIKGETHGLVKIQSNLWNVYPDCVVESINWIGSTTLFSWFNKINNKRLAKSILKTLDRLEFKQFILFNDNEIFKAYYLQEYLNPLLSIYYSRDFMLGVDYWRKHGKKLEPLLIAKSDLCLTNSEYLSDYCRLYNQNSYNIGQGCDIEIFKNLNIKEIDEFKNIKEPIIGYVGALNSERLDIDIIAHIARSYVNYSVVLIGPEDEIFRKSVLHELSNVIFLGQRDVLDLPDLINNFDVCINPQLVNEITIGNYPRKIDEYLALGKPVVATRTKTMEVFDEYVYLAENKEDYITFISKALEESSVELRDFRQKFAFTHTWENSVKEMKSKISLLIGNINN